MMLELYAHDVPEAAVPSRETVRKHLDLLLDCETPHRLAIAWGADRQPRGLAAVALFVSVSDPRPDRWRQMELKELFVMPDHRDAGIGVALVAWIEAQAQAKGVCRIDWHVKSDNHRGIAFYERFGGQIIINRLSMRKPLNTSETIPWA